MNIRFHQLAGQLKRGLAPVYLLCGEEPFQLGEAARLVREHAKRKGFAERDVFDADSHFDWNQLAQSAEAMSLFSSRKVIEVRVSKLGKDGGAAVRAYCDRPCADNLLLILAPELGWKELQAAWAKAVEAIGVVLEVRALAAAEFEAWLKEHLSGAGFDAEAEVVTLLAERAEGNLLAAVQEIEKLRLLHPAGTLTTAEVLGTVADNARYDLYALMPAALAGERARAQRIVWGLQAEGGAIVLVLWAVSRELRMLAEAAGALARREALEPIFQNHRVMRARQDSISQTLRLLSPQLLRNLLQQCLQVDLAIKGQIPADPWQQLAKIVDRLALRH
jgi:DNA polymerase III subunit delta